VVWITYEFFFITIFSGQGHRRCKYLLFGELEGQDESDHEEVCLWFMAIAYVFSSQRSDIAVYSGGCLLDVQLPQNFQASVSACFTSVAEQYKYYICVSILLFFFSFHYKKFRH
jgi:hypothetical protein